MDVHYSIAEAKSRLPAIIHSIEKGGTATLTRHGRAVAVLLSVDEYERHETECSPYGHEAVTITR